MCPNWGFRFSKDCRSIGPFLQSASASDLGNDWYKVLGSPPIVLARPPTSVAEIGYDSGVVLFLGARLRRSIPPYTRRVLIYLVPVLIVC